MVLKEVETCGRLDTWYSSSKDDSYGTDGTPSYNDNDNRAARVKHISLTYCAKQQREKNIYLTP